MPAWRVPGFGHSEPIVLVGIPESKIQALTARYTGFDLPQANAEREPDIISGATVTVVVIDDSILHSGIRVARLLGLGGMAPEADAGSGPGNRLAPDSGAAESWMDLLGDGSIRRLHLDLKQVNSAFAASGDARTAARPERGAPGETFIDLYATLATAPAIGRSLLGQAELDRLDSWLEPGEHALLIAARGRYSFKGSGYVRGGIFDRIHLVQGDRSVRFRDRQHRRLGALATADAPRLSEIDLFRIPPDSGFGPALAVSAPLGARFSESGEQGHILDPRSGCPGGKWRQVAVMAPGAALADALSTALCLLPEEKVVHVQDI